MRWLCATCRVLVLTLALAVPAQAAEPATPPATKDQEQARSAAKVRYTAGVAAYREGRYREAVEHFLEADRLAPSAAFSFNIARAYSQASDLPNALRWYRDYLRRSPDASNASEVRARVLEYERELAKRGLQQLTIESTPPAATVVLNDKPVGVTPWTGELRPGNYRLELSLRGFADATRNVVLPPEHALDVSVDLTRSSEAAKAPGPVGADTGTGKKPSDTAVAAAPADAAKSDASAKKFGNWPWITLGAGGVVLSGALVFELLRDNSEDRARRERTQIGFHDALEQMRSRQTTARVLAGVGSALLLGGGVLVGLDLLPAAKRKSVSLRAGFDGAPSAFVDGTF
jgi:tetratricopeptide (TPR) repeat protein